MVPYSALSNVPKCYLIYGANATLYVMLNATISMGRMLPYLYCYMLPYLWCQCNHIYSAKCSLICGANATLYMVLMLSYL